MTEAQAMARAIALAAKGYPAPNPRVGCVLLRNGEVVGDGWHAFAGGPHAEAMALQRAGDRATGATALVTLEPCNHTGRTPPCSQSLIAAGVRRVVAAVRDPNPKAAGGLEALREAGVEVEFGLGAEGAERVNSAWLTAMRRRRPFVCLKAACSLDGRIALPSGESRWITGPAARREGHRLRAEMGAVLVGRRTVELDDPLLTVRLGPRSQVVNQPLRVVLDPSARLAATHRLFGDGLPSLRFVATGRAEREGDAELDAPEGRFDPLAVLDELFARGVTGLLVEGGGHTHAAFLPLADRLELFVGNVALGAGPAWLEGQRAPGLADCPRLSFRRARRLGPDLRLSYAREASGG